VRVFHSIGLGILCTALVIIAIWLWPSEPLPDGVKADQILVLKAQRRLVLLKGGTPLKSYAAALGRNPKGAKDRQGDGRTLEGSYRIDFRKDNSDFHRALHISYPNAEDSKRAEQLGVSHGGAIMVHGMKNGYGWIGNLHRLVDWTDGCIAVTNREIEEIWRAVPDGTKIEIRP
jgi:murein L,D-transpeptidase YafK